MEKQTVLYKDLGVIKYQTAWDYQEKLLQENVQLKMSCAKNNATHQQQYNNSITGPSGHSTIQDTNNPIIPLATTHHLLLCEHPPVYTLGKSGHLKNLLITEMEMEENEIEFFKINRGGDITFHGPGQLVGYPILDLEKFYTDIGRYLRALEEVIILTIAHFGVKGERSNGETGVWIDAQIKGRERKICAMGVRCSRWITMHGFALNVNPDLSYFENIIPCGIVDKKVTSLQSEINSPVSMDEVKKVLA